MIRFSIDSDNKTYFIIPLLILWCITIFFTYVLASSKAVMNYYNGYTAGMRYVNELYKTNQETHVQKVCDKYGESAENIINCHEKFKKIYSK